MGDMVSNAPPRTVRIGNGGGSKSAFHHCKHFWEVAHDDVPDNVRTNVQIPVRSDIATINHLQKEILKTLNSWTYIFYVPPIPTNPNDGIRYHNEEDIKNLDMWIKSYLEIENIPYIDLSKIDYTKRQDFVVKHII